MRSLALALLCLSTVAAAAEDARPFWPREMQKLHVKFAGLKERLAFVSCIQDSHPTQMERECDVRHGELQGEVDKMLARIEVTARASVYAGESAYESAKADTLATAETLEQECETLLASLETEE